MLKLLENLGYKHCGTIWLENGDERLAFQKAQACTPDISTAKQLISETFKELTIKKIALLGNGKAATIYLVNDEIVFKIPLQSEGEVARMQKNEADVLRFLEGKLDIEIPKILCTGISESGPYIIGETLLSGTPFSYELCDTYDDETKNDIQRQLGKIVRKLHEAGGNDSSWQADGYQETLDDLMGEFDKKLNQARNVFSSDEIAQIEEIANEYKIITINHPVKPVLCHHDLHYCNLMFDTKTKQISGLLDFGCAGYAEPAMDWHYYFNPKLVLEGYGDNGDKFFLQRQRFHALSHLLDNLNDEIADKRQPYDSLTYIKKFILGKG